LQIKKAWGGTFREFNSSMLGDSISAFLAASAPKKHDFLFYGEYLKFSLPFSPCGGLDM